MREPTDEEVRQFMQKYYPEWANNLELGRILYKKFMMRRVNGPVEEEVKIGDLIQYIGKVVTVKGIVTDIEVSEYIGCPICHRSVKRGCEHLMSGQAREERIRRLNIEISDDTGSIKLISFPMNEQEWSEYLKNSVGVGDVIKVRGRVKEWNGVIEISFDVWNSLEIVRKVEVDIIDTDPMLKDIYETVKRLKRVKKQIYESMCRSKGVDPKALIEAGYLIEDEEYVGVKEDGK